jgi:hypothetical protein
VPLRSCQHLAAASPATPQNLSIFALQVTLHGGAPATWAPVAANRATPTWYEHPYDGRNTLWPLRDGGGDTLGLALPNSGSFAEFKVRGADYRGVRLCTILNCPGHDIANLTPQIAMHTSVVRVCLCAHTAPALKLTSQHTLAILNTRLPPPHMHTHTHTHTHTHMHTSTLQPSRVRVQV